MIIDCISDLHGHYPKLEGGDLLIVAGDLTARDLPNEYLVFNEWLKEQEYKKKIVVSGNHDNCLQSGITVWINPSLNRPMLPIYGTDVTYLCDSGIEFEGLKIWGSPWTHRFQGINPKCAAFTLSSDELENKMEEIAYDDIDILVTHCPPFGILDGVERTDFDGHRTIEYTGSRQLAHGLRSSAVKLHVFGHIHEHGGKKEISYDTICVNASIVNERYEPVNKPVRVQYNHRKLTINR